MKTIGTWLVDIPPSECDELLASSTLGRLAVVVDGRPEIFPVNHVYDEFPSNAHTKLHAALNWPYVAFEIDGMEADRPTGWSVLVVGRAEEVKDEHAIGRWCARRDIVWRCGQQTHWLRIVPEKVTGRRISGPSS
jgi:nitroimidazol reductase NimA-like FMN-containing flavoprotein (pyridoxamine 5'-phosphate oxidase superfamily)